MREGPLVIRRGALVARALLGYVPRRRGARHFASNLSRALWLAKVLPEYGATWAWDRAEDLLPLVPEGINGVACPPASREGTARGFHFARELTLAVATGRGVPILRPLRWLDEGAESPKEIVHQAGKGRALARRVVCNEDLAGKRMCPIGDLFTTGITAELCAQALAAAGAERVDLVCLFRTEPTSRRPREERARIRERAEVRAAAHQAHTPCCPW